MKKTISLRLKSIDEIGGDESFKTPNVHFQISIRGTEIFIRESYKISYTMQKDRG